MHALKYLNKYFLKYRLLLIAGFFFVSCSNVFGIFSAQVIRHAVNLIKDYYDLYLIIQESAESKVLIVKIISLSLFILALSYFSLQLVKGLFMFLMRQTIIVTSRKIEYDVKSEIFSHFQLLPLSFFKENRVGDLMTRITEDVSKVRMYVGPSVMYTMNLISLFSITITIMFLVNIELSIYVLLPLPLLSYIIYRVSNIIYKKGTVIQNRLSKLTTISQEVFSGIRVIKSYTQENEQMNYFLNNSNDYKKESVDLAKVEAVFFPLVTLLIGLSTILTIYIGGKQVMRGEITYGNIVEFVYYINLLTWPVTAVGWIASLIQRAKVSQTRINEFLLTPVIKNEGDVSKELDGEIEFKNVSFTYPETGINAIKNLSLKIPKGTKVAIVGKTGSGKSTIASLLLRNYPEFDGEIRMDNLSINAYELRNYRSYFGFVPQELFLFSDTIENNIAFGEKKKNKVEVEKYGSIAALNKDIEGFQNGYQTKIGERGIALSGGQKQRITIARALIKQPKLLLLDDCLSAVDVKTEYEILNNLQKEFVDKTVLIITHRTLSLSKMDHIVYIDNGTVLEEGSFEELIKMKGKFYQLHQQQKIALELKKD